MLDLWVCRQLLRNIEIILIISFITSWHVCRNIKRKILFYLFYWLILYRICNFLFNLYILCQKTIISFGFRNIFDFIFLEFVISFSKFNLLCGYTIIKSFLSLFLNSSNHIQYCCLKLFELVL